jgi:hypothetical protein
MFSFHHHIQTGSGSRPACYQMGTDGSFPEGKEAGGVKLTSHLHLVLRLRMCGAVLPLAHRDNVEIFH